MQFPLDRKPQSLLMMIALLGALILTFGCSSSSTAVDEDTQQSDTNTGNDTTTDADTVADTEQLPQGCDHLAKPGSNDQEDLQTLFITAGEGQTVCLGEGTFKLTAELSINKKNLTLKGMGREKTILDFTGQTTGNNGLSVISDGVLLIDFQVKNSKGDGIRVTGVDGITFQNLIVIWTEPKGEKNGAYGLYPVESSKVLIDNCLVEGARDAGIYVGQSNQVLVKNSEAKNNVAGIEIENTTDAEVTNCNAHDNVAGILVFNLPGLQVKDGKQAKIHNNIVENNNVFPNWGEPGTVVQKVPAGIGIMIMASDKNEVHDNTIKGNRSIGILIKSYDTVLFDPWTDTEFEPLPQSNYIHNNTMENNGTDPIPLIANLLKGVNPIPSIVWDGCEDDKLTNDQNQYTNCIKDNGTATYLNYNQCKGGTADVHDTDISKVTCTQTPLSPQTWVP